MDGCRTKNLEDIEFLWAAAWSSQISLLQLAECMLHSLQQGLKLAFHWHFLCQRQVRCCSQQSTQ